MSKLKYSVLMSVYYKEKPNWLRESIESMLNQTIPCDEFVIIKDGPLTKELDDVIEEYSNQYPSLFNIVSLEKNIGLGLALKLGVQMCKNELIARMDSDDYSLPSRCEKQLRKFKDIKGLDIVGSNIIEFVDGGEGAKCIRRLPLTNEEIIKFSKKRNPFGHPSVMFKKSSVINAGNYRDYYLCEDYDMWIRMIENQANCLNIDEPLVYMRISADFYKRRGGIKYLKSILTFKKELYKKKYYSFLEYIVSILPHIVVCLIPNNIRDLLYKKFLREGVSEYE